MPLSLKKSTLPTKRRALLFMSFCILLSLFFSSTSYAATYEEQAMAEFAQLESCLQRKTIKPFVYIKSIIEVNIENQGIVSEVLLERRNELVKLGTSAGADANQVLSIAVNQYPPKQEDLINIALDAKASFTNIKVMQFSKLPSRKVGQLMLDHSFNPTKFFELIIQTDPDDYNDPDNYKDLDSYNIEKAIEINSNNKKLKDDLIEMAQEKGIDYSKVKIKYLSALPTVEVATTMLDNSFDPTFFLALILGTHSHTPYYSLFLSLQEKLVLLSLKKGADPDRLIQTEEQMIEPIIAPDGLHLMRLTSANPQILEVLFNNEYKKMDPALFCKYLDFIKSQDDYTKYFNLETKYKNLDAQATSELKIPRIIHHIWLTNDKQRREIPEEDIQHVLNTEEIFAKSGYKWEHVVWTNDKRLIPASVQTLEASGIKVRELSEIEEHLRLTKKIRELIEQEEWGMASDTLRYSIVYYMGGVYSDLNFVFTRDVEKEVHTFDFFNHSTNGYHMENSFFGAKPNHPILSETLNLVEKNFNNPPHHIIVLSRTKSRLITDEITYMPLNYGYYMAANNNTIDIIYPQYKKVSDNHFEYKRIKTVCMQDPTLVIEKYTSCAKSVMAWYTEQKKLDLNSEMHEICGIEDYTYGHDIFAGSWMNN